MKDHRKGVKGINGKTVFSRPCPLSVNDNGSRLKQRCSKP